MPEVALKWYCLIFWFQYAGHYSRRGHGNPGSRVAMAIIRSGHRALLQRTQRSKVSHRKLLRSFIALKSITVWHEMYCFVIWHYLLWNEMTLSCVTFVVALYVVVVVGVALLCVWVSREDVMVRRLSDLNLRNTVTLPFVNTNIILVSVTSRCTERREKISFLWLEVSNLDNTIIIIINDDNDEGRGSWYLTHFVFVANEIMV